MEPFLCNCWACLHFPLRNIDLLRCITHFKSVYLTFAIGIFKYVDFFSLLNIFLFVGRGSKHKNYFISILVVQFVVITVFTDEVITIIHLENILLPKLKFCHLKH